MSKSLRELLMELEKAKVAEQKAAESPLDKKGKALAAMLKAAIDADQYELAGKVIDEMAADEEVAKVIRELTPLFAKLAIVFLKPSIDEYIRLSKLEDALKDTAEES